MQLASYLAESGRGSAANLARACNVTPSTISRTAQGKMTPTLSLVAAIEKHTGGVVRAQDFFENLPPCPTE